MLYLVGTPIGNLGDLSDRAKEILASADRIACEDTRRTGLLLSRLGIQNRLISYHEHNRASKGAYLISLLMSGEKIALVSDAGMPCVSDPGEDLVRLCAEKEIPVTVIPGPVAGIAALSLSGLDTSRFVFEGFLPAEGKARKDRLRVVSDSETTVILYEAPHRLQKTLGDLSQSGCGSRRIAICRELTKKYEEVIRTTVDEAIIRFEEKSPKGEFVLVLEARSHELSVVGSTLTKEARVKRMLGLREDGLSTKEIAAILAEEWHEPKRNLYSWIIKMIN